MQTYLTLIFALFTQWTFFSHIAIFQAYSSGISWFQIHLLWVFITILDIAIPYFIGTFLVSKITKSKLIDIVKNLELKLGFYSKKNLYLILFLLGIFNYVYVNAFLIAFIKINTRKALLLTFLGDLVWYIAVVLSTLSGINILGSIQTFSIAIIIFLIFAMTGEELLRRSKKNK